MGEIFHTLPPHPSKLIQPKRMKSQLLLVCQTRLQFLGLVSSRTDLGSFNEETTTLGPLKFPESQWSRLPWQPGRVKCFKIPESKIPWQLEVFQSNSFIQEAYCSYPKQSKLSLNESLRCAWNPQLLGGFLALAIISDPNDKNHPEKLQLCSQVGPSLCLGSWCQEPRCLRANQRESNHKSKNHMSFPRKKTKRKALILRVLRVFFFAMNFISR